MKIAVIGVPGIPTNQEGIERYCQELYPRIVVRRHQANLFVQAKYHHQPWFLQLFSAYFRLTANRVIPATKFGVLDNQF